MITATVGPEGRLTIPKAVREQLAVDEGDRVAFLITLGSVTIEPLNKTLFDMRGTVSVERPQDFEQIRRKTIETRTHPRRWNN